MPFRARHFRLEAIGGIRRDEAFGFREFQKSAQSFQPIAPRMRFQLAEQSQDIFLIQQGEGTVAACDIIGSF